MFPRPLPLPQGFATDKKGVIEYSGRELGSFITLLAKGNPKNVPWLTWLVTSIWIIWQLLPSVWQVELLFSNKPAHRSWAWQELLGARQCFLTLRCESWTSVGRGKIHDDMVKQTGRVLSAACQIACRCFSMLVWMPLNAFQPGRYCSL